MTTALRALTVGTALGCGTAAGVFFGFSSFVMAGLARLPPAHGMAAMQSINVTAVRPAFMTALFGTAAGCVALTVVAVRSWGGRPAVLLVVGSALYLVGVVGLTVVHHVPLNDSLAAADPGSAAGVALWRDYLGSWTTWNHVRAGSALAAAAAFTLALLD